MSVSKKNTKLRCKMLNEQRSQQQSQQQKQQIQLKQLDSLLRMKKEIADHYYLCLIHREISAQLYDYYMDFSPETTRRAFSILFELNKLFRLVLIHFLFYHSVWWSSNSVSDNNVVNYSLIDYKLLLVLVYLNFYDLLISQFLIQLVTLNLLKSIGHFSTSHIRKFLTGLELAFYAICESALFFFLRVQLEFSLDAIAVFMAPHLLFFVYTHFDLELTLFNICFITNLPFNKSSQYQQLVSSHSTQMNHTEVVPTGPSNQSVDNSKNSNLVFTDCSNLSINTYLSASKISPVNTGPINSVVSSKPTLAETLVEHKMKKSSNSNGFKINKQSSSYLTTGSSTGFMSTFRNKLANKLSRITILYPIYWTFYHVPFVYLPRSSRFVFRKRTNLTCCETREDVGDVERSMQQCAESFKLLEHKCEPKHANYTRDENDLYRYEFNIRLREILVRTVEHVYTNFVLTRLCVPQSMSIRDNEYLLYLVSSLVGAFLTYWIYYLPTSFIITLNRNAEHLGEWKLEKSKKDGSKKEEDTTTSSLDQPPPATYLSSVCKWMDTRVYYKDERAVYMGKVYRVDSMCSCSVPDDSKQRKFFRLFSNPLRIVSLLLLLKLGNLTLLGAYTALNRRWYSILTNLVEILFNCHTFFIVLRDFFLIYSSNKSGLKNRPVEWKFNSSSVSDTDNNNNNSEIKKAS